MNLLDEKINEVGKYIGVVSFDKGTDNYNKLKSVLTDVYNAGVNGKELESDLIEDVLNDEDYPLTHD
jgi:hypothetical protein